MRLVHKLKLAKTVETSKFPAPTVGLFLPVISLSGFGSRSRSPWRLSYFARS